MADFSCFDSPDALALNKARMDHFDSLDIPLEGKSVLEVGCGVGHFTRWLYTKKPLILTSVDGNQQNLIEARQRLRELLEHCNSVRLWTVLAEELQHEDLDPNGVTFCYGLLYHLENPLLVLRNLAAFTKEMIAIESIVCDSHLPMCLLQPENARGQNQGMSNVAMIPSIAFIQAALRAVGFSHVYRPLKSPEHEDFRWFSVGDEAIARNGANLRAVVIGSRSELNNERLYRV